MSNVQLLIPDDFERGAVVPPPETFVPGSMSGETMGTVWSARWFAPPDVGRELVATAFDEVFTSTIRDFSSWEPDSAVSRFNRLRAGESLEMSEDFARLLDLALEIARASHGAFDPCLGGDVVARGFGPVDFQPVGQGERPGPEIWNALIDATARLRQPGGVVLDFSGIAKGHAVDRLAQALRHAGVNHFLVEIGGECIARAVKPGSMPWWVELENPVPAGAAWRVAACGHAIATSGDYRQMRVVDGKAASHIVPVKARRTEFGDLASVTIVHENCAAADAWATALFASGDAGLEIANARGLAALFQYRDAPPRMSDRLGRWLD